MKGRLYLTFQETEMLPQATADAMHGLHDRCMILMGFYHGLRVSELTGLAVRDVDFSGGSIFIRQLKNGCSTVHPLQPVERRLLALWIEVRLSQEGSCFSTGPRRACRCGCIHTCCATPVAISWQSRGRTPA